MTQDKDEPSKRFLPIFNAALEGDVPELERLLSLPENSDFDINKTYPYIPLPLISVAQSCKDKAKSEACVAFLEEKVAKIREESTFQSPLIKKKRTKREKKLLKETIGSPEPIEGDEKIKILHQLLDEYAQSKIKQSTPLHWAVQNKKIDALNALIKSGADINATDKDGFTPLHKAVQNGKVQAAQALLDARTDLNAVDEYGWTPLHWAVKHENKDALKALIKAGANLNVASNEGLTPLNWLARFGDESTAQVLIEAGADVNVADNKGLTPLHSAGEFGYASTAQALINARANLNAADNQGRTPLHLAAIEDEKDILETLMKAGANLNAKDHKDHTPLHLAVMHDKKDIAQALIEAGADLNAVDEYGYTPLKLAVYDGRTDVLKSLIDAGANVNIVHNEGWTPLHLAVRESKKDALNALIKAGANLNAVNEDGSTPLHFAVEFNHKDIAKALIKAGANLNAVNEDGSTPLHFAVEFNHKDIAKALIEAGANVIGIEGDMDIVQQTIKLDEFIQTPSEEKAKALSKEIDNSEFEETLKQRMIIRLRGIKKEDGTPDTDRQKKAAGILLYASNNENEDLKPLIDGVMKADDISPETKSLEFKAAIDARKLKPEALGKALQAEKINWVMAELIINPFKITMTPEMEAKEGKKIFGNSAFEAYKAKRSEAGKQVSDLPEDVKQHAQNLGQQAYQKGSTEHGVPRSPAVQRKQLSGNKPGGSSSA